MQKVWILTLTVLAVLLIERVGVHLLTRSEKNKRWVRAHRLIHPNSISLIRVPMGLVSVLLWLSGWQMTSAIWFAVWMISDITDGTLARNCNLTTESGKWLDPLSDKCMYFPPLLMFSLSNGPVALPLPWVVILLVTDAMGQCSRLFAKKKAANLFGKCKTALITVLLTLTALEHFDHLWFMSNRLVNLMTISCAVLAFLSFYCKVIPDLWYANSLTLANFICGLAAIWNALFGRPLLAFIFVFVGQFFDLFDGRLARRFGSTRHGAIFDDIADGTSFGVAIGVLIVTQLGTGMAGSVVAALYVLCVVYRLYRFLHPPIDLPNGIFQGLPSPAGAMLAGSATLLFADLPALASAIVFFSSMLMVSGIRYRHFGHRMWPALPKGMKLLAFVLFLIFVNMSIADKNYSGSFILFCFTMGALYVIFGVEYRGKDGTALTREDAAAERASSSSTHAS